MSDRLAFHAQLASIMEDLANAAVAEICKLVDGDYAVVSLQMSQCQRENKALKRKLHMLERKLVRGYAERCFREGGSHSARPRMQIVTGDRHRDSSTAAGQVSARKMALTLWSDKDATGDTGSLPVHSDNIQSQLEDVELMEPGVELVKEEKVEANVSCTEETEDILPVQDNGVLLVKVENMSCTEEMEDILPVEVNDTLCRRPLPALPESGQSEQGEQPVLAERKRSPVWTFFTAADQDTATCDLCKKAVRHCGNTTNLHRHIKAAHPQEIYKLQKKLKKNEEGGEPQTQSRALMQRRGSRAERNQEYPGVADRVPQTGRTLQLEQSVQKQTHHRRSRSTGNNISRTVEVSDTTPLLNCELSNSVEEKDSPQETLLPQQCMNDSSSSDSHFDLLCDGKSTDSLVEKLFDAASAVEAERKLSMAAVDFPSTSSSVNGWAQYSAGHRIGTKPRLLACSYCGKGFNGPKKLEIHERIHTGVRPFSCSTCGRAFAEAGNLKKHQRVHTGEKPYKCGMCGKGFSCLRNLKTHQLKNHLQIYTEEETL